MYASRTIKINAVSVKQRIPSITGSLSNRPIFINFNVVDRKAEDRVLPTANARGMGVFAREAFVKGRWFEIGQQAGITDRSQLAQVAIKWVLSHQEVTTVVVGMDNPEQMESNLAVLEDIALDEEDQAILRQVQTVPLYQEVQNQKASSFMQ